MLHILQVEPEPISIYHPTAELSTTMGAPMEGFFDGVDVVAMAMAPAAAQGVPFEMPIPSIELGPVKGGA